jgi:hypothetical protein
MTTRRSFLASLLVLPVVARAAWSIAPPMFHPKRYSVSPEIEGSLRRVWDDFHA